MTEPTEPLFSFGTLQQADVQRALFGRELTGDADLLTGFRLGTVTISDPEVIRKSGSARHPGLVADANAGDRIPGKLFRITKAELAAADSYESGEYVRQHVTLESGRDAWIYVAAPGVTVE